MSLWQKMTDKDRQIAAACAFNAVASYWPDNYMDTLCADDDNNRNGWRQAFEELLAFEFDAFKHLLDSVESFEEINAAVSQVQGAFPGAVDVTQQQPTYAQAAQVAGPQPPQTFNPPSNVVPFPQPQAVFNPPPAGGFQVPQGPPPQQFGAPQQFAPQQFPQQPGGGSKIDQLWADLIQNAQNWNDVRAQKRSQSSPDFVHKFLRSENGKEQALWLQGRFGPAPQWVFQQLQAQGRL